MKRHHITGLFSGAEGTQLFYQRWSPQGSPKEPTAVLVFIHGMAEHSDRYQFPIDYFIKKGFAVYAMDLRGHGASEGRRAYANSLDQLLEDLRLFLEKVRKEEPHRKIFLIGHSFGGQLVLNYGSRSANGISGIIVSSPNIFLEMKVPWAKRLAAPFLSRLVPILALGNELDPTYVSHDPTVVEGYRRDAKVQKKITSRLANIVLKNQSILLDLAKRFHVPALFLHAGDDKICSPEGTRQFFERVLIPDKTFKVYKGFYHELFNEIGREVVFRDMETWIRERV